MGAHRARAAAQLTSPSPSPVTMRRLRFRLSRIFAPLAVGAVLLAVWGGIVRGEDIPPYILPGPLLIAETLRIDRPSLLGSVLLTLRISLAALAGGGAFCGAAARFVFFFSRAPRPPP